VIANPERRHADTPARGSRVCGVLWLTICGVIVVLSSLSLQGAASVREGSVHLALGAVVGLYGCYRLRLACSASVTGLSALPAHGLRAGAPRAAKSGARRIAGRTPFFGPSDVRVGWM
jgi:hypothetical protein